MHGQPTWSYLYRKMIPLLVKKNYRVIAPDLVGFGKSDKFTDQNAYTYENQVRWFTDFFKELELTNVYGFFQDWGGLTGIRVVANLLNSSEHRNMFQGLVVANTGLPTGFPLPKTFKLWVKFCKTNKKFNIGNIVKRSMISKKLTKDEIAAYSVPFPSEK
eukprot:UN28827